MEVDESMGEDARSIAYFDLCVSSFFFSFAVLIVLMRVDMRVGFCNVRAVEIYFHTGDQRCHLTTRMLVTVMMSWNLLARVRDRMTKMSSRAQANMTFWFYFL